MGAGLDSDFQDAIPIIFTIVFPVIAGTGEIGPTAPRASYLDRYGKLPTREGHYIAIVRGILLKGVGLEALWVHVLALAGFAIALLTISARRFRGQLS